MEKKNIMDIYLEWKELKSKLVKESTMGTYVINAEKHLLPAFGKLTAVSESDVQAFALDMLGRGLSVKTTKDLLILLKMIVGYGRKAGYLSWADWEIRLPREDDKQDVKVLTPMEQKKIMKFLKENFSFKNLGLYVCLCTGMRIGEICALRWRDVDIYNKTISVNKTIERVYVVEDGLKRTKVVIGTPKTASSRREIPIGGELVRMFRPLIAFVRGDYYVLTNGAKPLEPRVYRRYYKNVMDELGMSGIKFHGLRHTFATRCIESKCDYKTVSSILGHSNISTTLNLYVHPDMGQKRRCIDKMLKTIR